MPSLKTQLLMDSEQFDAALVRSRAVAAVAGQDIQRSLTLKISKMEENLARMPQGPARLAAEESLQAMKMRQAVATQRAITAMTIAEYERRTAADLALSEAATAKKAGELALLATVARGAGAGVAQGGHGGGGMSGIIRESLVLVREFFRGNFTRMAGSVTLLAQCMGLLGTVIKSTAADAIMASVAETKLSQSMAATALAAEAKAAASLEAATAVGADLAATEALAKADEESAIAARAAAVAQEAKAAAAAQSAEIAAASATVSIGPIGWVVLAVAVLGATVAGIAMHFHTLAVRAKNLADMLNPLRAKFTEQADALRENAKIHQEYLDWLKKVGEQAESLPDKIDKLIRKMREQASAEEELARAQGKSNTEILGMKKAEMEAELNVLTLAKLQAQRQSEDAGIAAADADAARQAFDPSKLKGAQKAATNAGSILDVVQTAYENEPNQFVSRPGDLAGAIGGPPQLHTRPTTENDPFTVKVGGKEVTSTLAEAQAAYKKATGLADSLAAKEEELNKALSDTKSTKEGKDKSVSRLKDQIGEIQTQIGIANTYGSKEASIEDGKKSGGSHKGSLNSQQHIGAYAAHGGDKQLHVLEKIAAVVEHFKPNHHPPVGTQKTTYGGLRS